MRFLLGAEQALQHRGARAAWENRSCYALCYALCSELLYENKPHVVKDDNLFSTSKYTWLLTVSLYTQPSMCYANNEPKHDCIMSHRQDKQECTAVISPINTSCRTLSGLNRWISACLSLFPFISLFLGASRD